MVIYDLFFFTKKELIRWLKDREMIFFDEKSMLLDFVMEWWNEPETLTEKMTHLNGLERFGQPHKVFFLEE